MENNNNIVFIGATGAVGGHALTRLLEVDHKGNILTLGRRNVEMKATPTFLEQKTIDIHDPTSYSEYIHGQKIAICTLGVGEPTKMSKADFIAIDKTAVLNFAKECKKNGVKHFHILSSIGVDSKSMNYYMRTKGELNEELIKLGFDRLCIYQPSMIMTPTNRYGFTQAVALAVWPKLDFILQNKARKYRGIKVDMLGKAIANNALLDKQGVEYLQYDDFLKLQSI
ncbi:NAD(P)H-binding protein [Flammeovirga sp. SubArs3]|uniref:NAD(P)H-binding protein n=1 Tax=Flammeovirga sp. SubArs3 TaxID=2995316 RepID=UPI00248CA796|nr:NAD(P)H-binding protein [Flammeovirga sp. SubArs3]